MGAISDDRGQEEVSVLTELEVQRWVDEALENAARATKCILEKFASLGVRRPDLDCGEASDFDVAGSKAAQTVMRIVTAYPRGHGALLDAGHRDCLAMQLHDVARDRLAIALSLA